MGVGCAGERLQEKVEAAAPRQAFKSEVRWVGTTRTNEGKSQLVPQCGRESI